MLALDMPKHLTLKTLSLVFSSSAIYFFYVCTYSIYGM